MRVALCLSGQPRGLPLSIDQLKWGLLDKNPDLDIFFHTWFDKELANTSFDSAQMELVNKVGFVHPNTEELLLQAYSPKAYIIEPQRDFAKEAEGCPYFYEMNPEKQLSMFFSMYESNRLKCEYEKKFGFKYDLVIRTRFDLWYYSKLKLSQFEGGEEYLWLPDTFQLVRQTGGLAGTMADIFAISSSENMDIFSSVYPHYRDYLVKDRVHPPFGENVLGYHNLVKNSQQVRIFPFQIEIMHRVIDMNSIKQ